MCREKGGLSGRCGEFITDPWRTGDGAVFSVGGSGDSGGGSPLFVSACYGVAVRCIVLYCVFFIERVWKCFPGMCVTLCGMQDSICKA